MTFGASGADAAAIARVDGELPGWFGPEDCGAVAGPAVRRSSMQGLCPST